MDLRDITIISYNKSGMVLKTNPSVLTKFAYKNTYELEDLIQGYFKAENNKDISLMEVFGYDIYGSPRSRKYNPYRKCWIEFDFLIADCDYTRPYPVYVFNTTIPGYQLGVLYNETERNCVLHIMEEDIYLPKLNVTGTESGEQSNPNKSVYVSNQFFWSFDENMLKGFVEQWKENFTKI